MKRVYPSRPTYGRLTLVGDPYSHNGLFVCDCLCECGVRKTIRANNLINGNTKSCGCLNRERLSSGALAKHRLKTHPLYSVWMGVRQRCQKEYCKSFKDYGGRGIKVCDEWAKDFMPFYNWAVNNGYKKGLQLDRINNNGDYEPSNCQFITQKENLRKTRNVKLTVTRAKHIRILHKLSGMTAAEISRLYGVSVHNIYSIIYKRSWV